MNVKRYTKNQQLKSGESINHATDIICQFAQH
jgi:hypothetical protein